MKKTILKVFVIIISALAVLLLLCLLLSLLLNLLQNDSEISYDVSEDIYQDEYYLGLDRNVVYDEFGDSEPITAENLATFNQTAQFFYYYFECVKNGDNDQYSSFFSDDYIKNNKLPLFTKQKLYDITVTLYDTDSDGSRVDTYIVTFKIKDNNNSFCEIANGLSKTLVYKLIYVDDKPLINAILERKVVYD